MYVRISLYAYCIENAIPIFIFTKQIYAEKGEGKDARSIIVAQSAVCYNFNVTNIDKLNSGG